jgi:predicted ester cyclase
MKRLLMLAVTITLLYSCSDNKTSTSTSANDSLSNNSSSMAAGGNEAKEERNKQIALASVHGFDNGGTVDAVLKDMDKDGVDYGEGSMAPMKGLDSTKAGLGAWMKAVPDYKGSDLMAVADGDYVMVYGTWTGTWKNDLMGMKPTGKSFKVKDVDIFKFNNAGKIIEHRSVQSMNEASRQLGMKMPTQQQQ